MPGGYMSRKILRLSDLKKKPRCPLCHKWMEKNYDPARNLEVWSCHTDRISVRTNDPVVGKWEEAYEKIEKIKCPFCETIMRFFCTSVGYMKAKCPKPKCSTAMEVKGAPPEIPKSKPTLH